MKTLIVYFPSNKKIEVLVNLLSSTLKADCVKIEEVVKSTFFNRIKSKLGWGSSIYPLNVNFLDYDNIILVTQTFGKHISPAMYTFIREYSFNNKNLYCLLCFNKDIDKATKSILHEVNESESICKAIIKIKTDENTISALKEGKVYLTFDRNNKIILRDKKIDDFNNSGLTKKDILDMQVKYDNKKDNLNDEDVLLQYNIRGRRNYKKGK